MKVLIYSLVIILLLLGNSCSNKNNTNEILEVIKRLEKNDSTITENEIINILNSNKNDSLAKILYDKSIMHYYNENPKICLNFLKMKSELMKSKNDLSEYAICIQNMAFVYDEKFHNYNLAKKYSKEALTIWEQLNDTLNTANMLKYIGYIYGKLGKYNEAKKYINSAINKYNTLKFNQGKAVCYNNLALLYLEKGVYDSALYYFNCSKDIWAKYSDTSRIFKINNYIIQLAIESNDSSLLKKSYTENNALIESNMIQKEDINKFKKLALHD